jgi:hypothetical protein
MRFGNLTKWQNWWYLPRMDALSVFDFVTGERVAEWYVNYTITNSFDNRPQNWTFQCLVNTLPPDAARDFGEVVKGWEDYINARLKECYAQ